MNCCAVIPARAGSKRVPGKNTRACAGLPLWRWSLNAARKSKLINTVILTTDIPEILSQAPVLGCVTVQRPAALADDNASLDDALVHAVLKTKFSGAIVVLQPTVPVRRSGLIDDCVRAWETWGANSVLTANELHYVWEEYERSPFARLVNGPRVNRQSMTNLRYHEDGSVFVVHTDELLSWNSRIVAPVHLFLTPRTVDIDTEEDFRLAEFLLRLEK